MPFIAQETRNSVSIIALNRPEKFNSFCREMALDLQQALRNAEADTNIRAIVLTGTGKAFCAGQDLAEAIEDNGISLLQIVEEHYNPIIQQLRTIEKPIVVAVNGVAAGAGANIALAGDVVVAAESASFIQAFSKIGLIPDSGGTFILPRLIGWQRASALMMLGEKVSATEAMHMGMIYKTFPDADLQTEALKLAETLAQMPTIGLGLTKRLLNESAAGNDLFQQLQREADIQVQASETYDFQEGVNAFLEKRKPVFKGQ